MVKAPQRQTVYADYLYLKMDELLDRVGGFTLDDLALSAGLKITGNMRRRVQHCVVAGTLEVHPVLKGVKGSVNVYSRPEVKHEGSEPF